jgi:DNA-binding HxlR family transcriptional regulator
LQAGNKKAVKANSGGIAASVPAPHCSSVEVSRRPSHNHQMKAARDYSPKIDSLRDHCPVRAAIDVLSGRWKPSILWELKAASRRYSDLQGALPGISAQALTLQLRQLESDGIVLRTVYPEIPARVEYSLTDHGRSLSQVMDELERWGVRHLEREGKQACICR